MHVDFSFCLIFSKELYFLWNRTFFPGTQAFASPPDMASSGVWENIILSNVPEHNQLASM